VADTTVLALLHSLGGVYGSLLRGDRDGTPASSVGGGGGGGGAQRREASAGWWEARLSTRAPTPRALMDAAMELGRSDVGVGAGARGGRAAAGTAPLGADDAIEE